MSQHKMMKTSIFAKTVLGSATVVALMMANTVYAATWQFTPKSDIGFYIKQMGVKTVDGQFEKVQSTFNLDPEQIDKAQAKLVMDVNSINLTHDSLKNMVLGSDYFDVQQHKDVLFSSTQFKPLGNNKYQISGDLTLRGVTKPVVFDAKIIPSKNPKVLEIEAATKIKRSDFGMKPALGGVGEMINIQVDGQLEQS